MPVTKDVELIGIRYSPWTEKARWALTHHNVPYRYSEHVILLGMPALRWKTRKLFKDLTVPALVTRGKVLTDSYDIARFADETGSAEKLFAAGEPQIRRFNELSERALDAGRALLVARMLTDREAMLEQIPPFLPRSGVFLPLVKMGLAYLNREFAIDRHAPEAHASGLRATLGEIRESLKGRPYLLDQYSYADIAAAVTLQTFAPVPDRFIPLSPTTRAVWTDEKLKSEFLDLVEWRDTLYAKHRIPKR